MIYRMTIFDNGTFYYDEDDLSIVVYKGINVLEDITYYYDDSYPSDHRQPEREIIVVEFNKGVYG